MFTKKKKVHNSKESKKKTIFWQEKEEEKNIEQNKFDSYFFHVSNSLIIPNIIFRTFWESILTIR